MSFSRISQEVGLSGDTIWHIWREDFVLKGTNNKGIKDLDHSKCRESFQFTWNFQLSVFMSMGFLFFKNTVKYWRFCSAFILFTLFPRKGEAEAWKTTRSEHVLYIFLVLNFWYPWIPNYSAVSVNGKSLFYHLTNRNPMTY